MRRFMAALAVAGFAMGASTPTFAQTTATKSGRILALFFSSPGNGSFRVTLDTPLTGCAGNFAYVNTTFGNYEAYVSGLLSAQAQNKVVNLTYSIQGDGYCTLLEYGFSV